MNVAPKPCCDNQERRKLLREIGKIDFVVIELNLYLDTHPFDQTAIEKFKDFQKVAAQKKREYAEKFGPLEFGGSIVDNREWKWATQDWPWERGYY